MPLTLGPDNGASFPSSLNVYTRSQTITGTGGPKDLTTIDPALATSWMDVNMLINNVALTGAEMVATTSGNGIILTFERQPFGGFGNPWVPTAAMDVTTGIWDYAHRIPDGSAIRAFLVPAMGSVNVRIRKSAGPVGANSCLVHGIGTHVAFPTPPQYVGKRDVTYMVKNFNTTANVYGLATFDFLQQNDDRTATYTTGVSSRAVRAGRRLWVQGYDVSYSPSGGTDRARVVLISRPNGAVTSAAGALTNGTVPSFDIAVNTAPGRTVVLPEPLEFQNALGSMNVGIAAWGTVGVGNLNVSLFGFETL